MVKAAGNQSPASSIGGIKMTQYVEIHGLKVAQALQQFVETEALPGTGVVADAFWSGFSAIAHELAPKNKALLAKRGELQAKIDAWHRENGAPSDFGVYQDFLREIGYLLPEGPEFKVSTANVDPEIATMAGPQLVVPVMNARYALNAANARWGSLYDALYGTDAISEENGADKGKGYNPVRGDKVIAWARNFLNTSAPLEGASWADVKSLAVTDGRLSVALENGTTTGLADAAQFAGYRGDAATPSSVLLRKNGLHAEVVIDRDSPIGKTDKAGIADVILESALSTIQDCEDSIAAFDAED